MARLCPDQSFLSLCYRRHVAGLCMLYKVNSNSHQWLFSELPSASTSVHYRAAAAAHPLEFEVSRCRTSQFPRCLLPAKFVCGMTFSTQCLAPERWMGLREQSTVDCFHTCFFQFHRHKPPHRHVGLRKKFINHFVFPTSACAADFIYNNNISIEGHCKEIHRK